MTPLAARATTLFALAATIPVALTLLAWVAASSMAGGPSSAEADLARRRLEELEGRRQMAAQRLCRDDLAVDTLLHERGNDAAPSLDYDRLFRGAMTAAGLDALWVLDAKTGVVLARGHRPRMLGSDGSALARQANEASDDPFLVALGGADEKRFAAHACSIARSGARLTIVGAHTLATLRKLDPDQIVAAGKARAEDAVLLELADSAGVVQAVMVWRPRIARASPPLLLWLGCVAMLGLGLALVFGGYLNRWLQSSADELAVAATRVGRGDFDTTLRDDGGAAFPATATAFNRMTRDLRDARAQLRQTERVAAWQEIAKSLAHELKNPLSPIRLSIENLRKARSRSEEELDALFDESTKAILQEVERLRSIIDEFSRFARLPAPKLERTDLRETVSQAAALHGEGAAELVVRTPSTPVEARFDPDQIMQVLHNLLQNACDAAEAAHPDGGGTVQVGVGRDARSVWIRIEDDGVGIPADQAEAIFNPYFTKKEGGTGLGLAITQRIVTEHGGRIDVESRPGKTVFTVILPATG